MTSHSELTPLSEQRRSILSSQVWEYVVSDVPVLEGSAPLGEAIQPLEGQPNSCIVILQGPQSRYGITTAGRLRRIAEVDATKLLSTLVRFDVPAISSNEYAVVAVDLIVNASLDCLVVYDREVDAAPVGIVTPNSLSPVIDVLDDGLCTHEAVLGGLLVGTTAGTALFAASGAQESTAPEGPYVTKDDCECAIIVYVKDSALGSAIDALSGGYGYSHVAIDCCECEEKSGRRVIIEAVADGVIRSFADKYKNRPSVRIPLSNFGPEAGNCEDFCRRVKDHIGEPFDIPELITGGLIDDPDAQVCADLVTISIPPELLRRILEKLDGELKDMIKVKGNTILISPNAFAKCGGAPDGDTLTTPETPVPAPTPPVAVTPPPPTPPLPCKVKITLLRITHSGAYIGDDWQFRSIVQGRQRRFPEKGLLQNGTRHVADTMVDTKIGNCGDDITIDFLCEATEVDPFDNDFGTNSLQKKYKCPSQQLENIDVSVTEGSRTAKLTFVFEVLLTCDGS